jgi:hypothetical protein
VSGTVYDGHDAKLQSAEHGGIRGQHRARSQKAEISAVGTKRQVSSTEQSVTGAELEVLSTEQSMRNLKGAKCLRAEQSADRHGASSGEHGAIRGRRKAGGARSGAIREWR